jgi:glycosyltransferase involved in cell wall biosynthesis
MTEIIKQFFDERLYIESYPDVASAGIDPWEHFRRYGIGERRQFSRLAPPAQVEELHGAYTNETIAKYLINLLDREGDDTDAKLNHAMRYGYGHATCKSCDEIRKRASVTRLDETLREHQPLDLIAFLCERINDLEIDLDDHLCVADYIQMYPDVADANVNAYFHYYTAGRAEGRRNRLSVSTGIAKEFHRLISHGLTGEPASKAGGTEQLAEKIADANVGEFYVLLSHDNPLENLGGIQQVVAAELDLIIGREGSYLHIFPEFSKASYDDKGDTDLTVGAIIDGTFCGYVRMSALVNILRVSIVQIAQLRIHHLFGQNRHTLDLLSKLPVRSKTYIIHDHSFLCDGYHLLRNNLSFCNSPSIDTPSCTFCVHGNSRRNRINLLNQLHEEGYTLNAPSKRIIEVCQKHHENASIKLLPHWSFSENKSNTTTPVRRVSVAYCGFDVFHKGYDLFKNSVKNNSSPEINFFYLGAQRPVDLPTRVSYIQVRSPHLDAQAFKIELIRRNIHVVIMPSRCPESFGFIAHEAKAAGCTVLVSNNPDQPVSEVQTGGTVRSVALNEIDTAITEECMRILRDGFVRNTLNIQFQSSL